MDFSMFLEQTIFGKL